MAKINSIDISITGVCNYKCEYCYGEFCQFDMKIETFKKIISLCKFMKIKNLEFCGGEPLIHKKFNEMVKMAKKEKFNLILRTNGIFIKNYIKLIKKSFDWVGISLDGTTKFNNLMRKGNLSAKEKFEIPIKNIFLVKKENPKIKILLASLASSKNYKNLPKLAEYILKNNIQIDLWKIYQFLGDKHKALKSKKQFELSNKKFNKLKKKKIFQQTGKIIFRDANKNKYGCLIIRPNGDICLGSLKISNIIKKPLIHVKKDIEDRLKLDLLKNKEETYFSK